MKTIIIDEIHVALHSERKARHELLQEYVDSSKREGNDEHFLVCDIGDIINKYQQWVRLFPRVKMFYAVKCNADKALLKILADLGASFDCASKKEIETVLDLGVNTNRVIYTHTQKPVSNLIYAERRNVSLLTFDCESELRKIKSHHPTARLIVRILLNGKFDAAHTLGNKFGCPSVNTRKLLQLAKELKLVVIGVSFHVGSGVQDSMAYIAAIKQSRQVFEIAREIGFSMSILDIGGGFPGQQATSDFFQEITNTVNETLDDMFPPEEGVDIIAEPGRYVAASAYTAVVNITGKRWLPNTPLSRDTGNKQENGSCEGAGNTLMYYVNDSIFGNFFARQVHKPGSITYVPHLFTSVADDDSHESVIWGFACTDTDCLNPSVRMPELDVGDWLYFDDMGAYTQSLSSNFNGLETPETYYYCLEKLWLQVHPEKAKTSSS